MENDIRDEFKALELTEVQKETSYLLRFNASQMMDFIDNNLKPSRETSLAKTKLEEFVMWANRSIAVYGYKYEILEENNETCGIS